MAISSIINTSLTGLFTSQESLRVTSNNIANVNTEGFSRQRVSNETIVIGGEANGVRVAEIERVVDKFLSGALRSSTSDAEKFTVKREFHDRLQSLLGRPDSDSTLSARIDRVFSSISDLALNPSDAVLRQAMIAEVGNFAQEISRLNASIQALRADVSRQMEERVATINEALRRIHELNPQIVREMTTGGSAAGLLDQRAQALATLSENMDIRTIEQGDGSIQVVTGSGTQLVGSDLHRIEYIGPGVVAAATQFPPITLARIDPLTGQPTPPERQIDAEILSGRLRGLLDLRDGDLVDLSISLGELAARVADEVNAVHNATTAVPPPNELVGQVSPVVASAPNFTGKVSFAIVDDSNQVVAVHEIDFDNAPPANFAALVNDVNAGLGGDGTMLLSGGVFSFKATDPSHGVVIVQDPDNPSDRAGKGFSHFFGMNNLLEGQVPGIYDTGVLSTDNHNLTAGGQILFRVTDARGRELEQITVTVTGTTFADMIAELNDPAGLGQFFTASLNADGTLEFAPKAGFDGAKTSIVNDSTDFLGTGVSFSELFGIGDRHRIDAATDFSIVDRIENDPNQFAFAQFDLSAALGEVALSAGDQRGLMAYQALDAKPVMFTAAGELSGRQVTLSGYAAAVLSNAGIMADRASNGEADAVALRSEIDQRNSDISGVNLDEELANLIIFQNSFNAAARILRSAQDLFDSLLEAV